MRLRHPPPARTRADEARRLRYTEVDAPPPDEGFRRATREPARPRPPPTRRAQQTVTGTVPTPPPTGSRALTRPGRHGPRQTRATPPDPAPEAPPTRPGRPTPAPPTGEPTTRPGPGATAERVREATAERVPEATGRTGPAPGLPLPRTCGAGWCSSEEAGAAGGVRCGSRRSRPGRPVPGAVPDARCVAGSWNPPYDPSSPAARAGRSAGRSPLDVLAARFSLAPPDVDLLLIALGPGPGRALRSGSTATSTTT
ncbi:hypothetical protein GCM10019017_11940 [Streptomyces showdoensis]